jgi:hypothetical protein
MKPLFRGVLLAALLTSVDAARADWVVQIAAFADSAFLRQIAESVRKAGFPVTTEPLARAEGPALTRLLAGPYETKAEAEAAVVQLAARGWPGYLKQRMDARKPTPRPAPPQSASPKPRPAAPPPAAKAPSKSRASVPPVPVRSEPTPSAPAAPSSRASPSLQPAQPAEPPPAPSTPSPGSASSQPAQPAELRFSF